MMRRGEVEGNIRARFYLLVVMELGPIVSRDGRKWTFMMTHEAHDSPVHRVSCPVLEFADQHQARLALDQSDDAVETARSHHSIDLPMAEFLARLDRKSTRLKLQSRRL